MMRGSAAIWLRRLPAWSIVAFCAAIALAYSSNVLQVVGIHNDYEMLYFKNLGFFFVEAEHLFSLARPVAALLTNLTVLPLQSLGDYRWSRIFSILTVCVMGTQMIAFCIFQLRTTVRDAVAVALVTFLVLSFIYSILNSSAWVPHLLTVLIAFGAYSILSRSNLQAIPFLILARQRDYRGLCRQVLAYSRLRPVWLACLIYQFALYDYPPNALILVLFPVISVLLSQAPRAYRTLVALRDTIFVGASLMLYSLSVKLLYIPLVRLFVFRNSEGWEDANLNAFESRVAQNYPYTFNTDLGEMLARFENLLKVAGDLWFLPQAQFHIIVGAVTLLVLVAAFVATLLAHRHVRFRPFLESAGIGRMRFDSWTSDGVVGLFVVVTCFVMAAAPVLASSGGFVTYRTITIPTALVGIVFVYAVRSIVETAWNVVGNPFCAATNLANGAMAVTVCAAVAASFHINYLTMKLAHNEFAYFTGIVRQAIDDKSKAVVLIDRRPFSLPEDNPVIYDQRGRAVPPYELGCFSGYCLQTNAILHIAAEELGHPAGEFKMVTIRGTKLLPGLTCEMLTSRTPTYPPNVSQQWVWDFKYYRGLAPLTCVTYSLAWHDIGVDLWR